MNPRTYPYLETGLEDLKGERWNDIPFLDGLYYISNFGRVKREARDVYTSDGKVMHFPERIIRCYPDICLNKSVGDKVYHLAASLTVDGRRYKFSVARIVYYSFVKEFNLDDTNQIVYAKDGNGKNIRPSNLKLSNLSGRAKRIFKRGRLIKDIESTYEEYIRTKSLKSQNPACKQVCQYTSNGIYLQTFPSIRTASYVTGVSESGILSVLKKRQIKSGGFVWSYNKVRKVDVESIRKANIERRNRMVGQKVTQYDLKGNKVAFFYTIAEASRQTDINNSDINAVVNGKQRSAGGYIWRKGIGNKTINVKNYKTGVAWRASKQQKKVLKYTIKGKPIKKYDSVKKAAEAMQISAGYISSAVRKNLNIRGYYWKFI
jgi:NUMOD4 motif/NUMOD1 domain